MYSMSVPAWVWACAVGYLMIGTVFWKIRKLRYVRVRAAAHYARYCRKLYRTASRDPWTSAPQIQEFGLLAQEAIQDALDLLEDAEKRSPIAVILLWPGDLKEAAATAWDTNSVCDSRSVRVSERLNQRNLRNLRPQQ